jgi:hypothetical protein
VRLNENWPEARDLINVCFRAPGNIALFFPRLHEPSRACADFQEPTAAMLAIERAGMNHAQEPVFTFAYADSLSFLLCRWERDHRW